MTRCPTCGHHNGGHADDCEGPPRRPSYDIKSGPSTDPYDVERRQMREDDPNAGTDYHGTLNR